MDHSHVDVVVSVRWAVCVLNCHKHTLRPWRRFERHSIQDPIPNPHHTSKVNGGALGEIAGDDGVEFVLMKIVSLTFSGALRVLSGVYTPHMMFEGHWSSLSRCVRRNQMDPAEQRPHTAPDVPR